MKLQVAKWQIIVLLFLYSLRMKIFATKKYNNHDNNNNVQESHISITQLTSNFLSIVI